MGERCALRFAPAVFVVQHRIRISGAGSEVADPGLVVSRPGITLMARRRAKQDDQSPPMSSMGLVPTFLVLASMAGGLLYVFVTFGMLATVVPMGIVAVLLKRLFGGGDGPGGFIGGGGGPGGGGDGGGGG